MGLSKSSVQFTLDQFNKGHFKGFESVIELGSQDLMYEPRQRLHEQLRKELPSLPPERIDEEFSTALAASTSDEFRVDWLYRLLGMRQYSCVDADGRYGAFIWDLNTAIPDDQRGRWDLVTNHGTLEHVFNVYQGFKNMHDLAHPGSVMLHLMPFQGHSDHGFFNFQPVLFDDLAAENGYEILDRCAIVYRVSDNAETAQIFPYTAEKYREIYFQDKEAEANYAVTLRKTTDAEFRAPFQGIYGSSCLVPSYRNSIAQQWGQKLMGGLFRNQQSPARRGLRFVKKVLGLGA